MTSENSSVKDMEKPVYITDIVDRKPDHPWRRVTIYNCYPDGTRYNPWEDFPELSDLSVHKDLLEEAKWLSLEFHSLGPHPSRDKAQPIVDKLIKICETPYEQKTDLEKWAHTATQMPGDIAGPKKNEIRDILTSKARGRVLEAMCGFNSYFLDSENISDVVAMDFCREMLERYEFPERKRILFDIDRISNGENFTFFSEGEFDTIGLVNGSNYVSNLTNVFTEFRRILSPSGKLLIVDHPGAGYGDQIQRNFNPIDCVSFMQEARFMTNIYNLDWLGYGGRKGGYFLLEGIKLQ